MLAKVIFTGAALLCLSQNADATKVDNFMHRAVRDYVDINGTTFYIDTTNGYYRDEAKTFCESLNMTMVTLDEEQKWNDILIFLSYNNIDTNWFWTSALKDEDSTTWYWETNGAEITKFYWKLGQPSLNETLIRTCINFSAVAEGWDDDDCRKYYLDAMCE